MLSKLPTLNLLKFKTKVKMAKEVSKIVKLQVRGGAANPSPPVGPALGAAGVNIMEFYLVRRFLRVTI